MIKIILPGTIRIKKNSRRFFKLKNRPGITSKPSKAYEQWEEDARKMALVQLTGIPIFRKDIHVQMMAYYKGHKPDLSGALESVGDCLEGLAWEDDKQIVSMIARKTASFNKQSTSLRIRIAN